jgi:hypothetical protein
MRRTALAASVVHALLFVASAPGFAQTQEQPTPSGTEVLIPDGTQIYAELKSGLDANKAKAGDGVKLEVMKDIRSQQTKVVLIPQGAKLFGEVFYVERYSERTGPGGTLGGLGDFFHRHES